ncbi:hypothetical protein [Rossellomorea sp. NS-SX7]|uniref:hypothetical protein n=1 Tax=Rossellomorea sp. NS-SX7 TaxID=3463856 RepID=UPI004059CE97
MNLDFTERELLVNKLREEGKTYRAIGEILGVSGSRVSHNHRLYKRKEKYHSVIRDYQNGKSMESIAEKHRYSIDTVQSYIWWERNKALKQ